MKQYKLYGIVVVQANGYEHYGEVVSHVIPADGGNPPAYMVRCVPGEPATVKRIDVDKLRLPDSSRRSFHVHYAIVASRFTNRPLHSFPVDMLRYDFAAPVNFHLVEGECGTTCELLKPFAASNDLVVATATSRVRGAWTTERWESFGWSVRPLKSVRLERRSLA